MSNRTIQGPVVLEGKGFVAKKNGDYKGGEFKRLTNIELSDGVLTSRAPIISPNYSGPPDSANGIYTNNNTLKFLGFHGEWSIYANLQDQFAVNSAGQRVKMFSPFNAFPTWSTIHKYNYVPAGFFTYNHIAYWIFVAYGQQDLLPPPNSSTAIFQDKANTSIIVRSATLLEDSQIGEYTADNLMHSDKTLFPIVKTPLEPDWYNFSLKNFFVYKDRLWLVTPKTIYFSAATSPDVFDVESGGGFFNFPHVELNYAFTSKDTIYVLADGSIQALTYTNDPNEDASISFVSDVLGAFHGTQYQDTPLVINEEGIFSINNLNLNRVMSSNFDYGKDDFDVRTLHAFEDYLIVNKHYLAANDGIVPTPENDPALYETRINFHPEAALEEYRSLAANTIIPNFSTVPIQTRKQLVAGQIRGYVRNNTGAALSIGAAVFLYDNTNINKTYGALKADPGTKYTFSVQLNKIGTTTNVMTPNLSIELIKADGTPSAWAPVIIEQSPTTGAMNTTAVRHWITFTVPNDPILNAEGPYYIRARIGVLFTGTYAANADIFAFTNMLLEETVNSNNGNTNQPGTFFDWRSYQEIINQKRIAMYKMQHGEVSVLYFPYQEHLNTLEPAVPVKGSSSSGNTLGYNTYFINLVNGSTHVLEYEPVRRPGNKVDGFIHHLVYNPKPNSVDNTTGLMMLACSGDGYPSSPANYGGVFHAILKREADPNNSVDWCYDVATQSVVKRPIIYELEIDSFVPDGNELLMKKFRTFDVMAKLPKREFKISFAFDDGAYGVARDFVDNPTSPTARAHYPHRVGINQRARSMSVLMTNPVRVESAESFGTLEISDMRAIYGYTQYAAISASYTK